MKFFASLLAITFFIPIATPVRGQAPAATAADLIVTATPRYLPLAALTGGERFPKGAELLLVHAGKAEPLLTGFWATADAHLSPDAKKVLFAAKPKAENPWQIWELSLFDRTERRLIAGPADAIRPLYLPSGQFVFALRTPKGFQLTVAGKASTATQAAIDLHAGDTLKPLSYIPANAIPADVLHDGRILFESLYPLGAGSTPEMFLVYSDGSGVESYRCDHGVARWGGRQLTSGDVVFTHGARLARFTSPLAHEAAITIPQGDYAGGIAETRQGDWLLSERADKAGHYALKQGKPGVAALRTLLARPG